jgi:hypothetical protein
MDPRTLTDRAHAALDRAAQARADDDGAGCLAALEEAWSLLLDRDQPSLFAKVAWRRAKAGYDFGDADAMLDAVTPLLEAGRPFEDHPPARRAMQPIATRWWDTRGYGDDRVARLWAAWAESYRREGDPWMAAQGEAQRAWHLACAGDHQALDALIERYLALDPRRFGTGPHRHPKAPDTPASVWWAQLDLVRTGLWAATWARRRERARDLLDALEDAAEAARLERPDEPWFLDPVLRAALAFGLDAPRGAYARAWLPALDRVDGPRGALHRSLARGLLHEDVEALEAAATQALEHHLGAERAGIGAFEGRERP